MLAEESMTTGRSNATCDSCDYVDHKRDEHQSAGDLDICYNGRGIATVSSALTLTGLTVEQATVIEPAIKAGIAAQVRAAWVPGVLRVFTVLRERFGSFGRCWEGLWCFGSV